MDPREKALNELNRMIADKIKEDLPPGVGFALLVFSFGPGGFMTYCSNSEREDMIKGIEELLEYVKGQRRAH